MASSSEVVKKVTRFKLQLSDTAESATVVKILQKLKDLEITLDVLAETGIGKTVNSLRRHEQAGEIAKSLVRDWKRLVPKESTSRTEDQDVSESLPVEDKLVDQNCPSNGLTMEDLNNNDVTSDDNSCESSDEDTFKTEGRKADSEQRFEEHKRQRDRKKYEDKQNLSQKCISQKKNEIHKEKTDTSIVSKRMKHDQSNRVSADDDDISRKVNSEVKVKKSREKLNNSSDSGRFGSEKGSNKKSKTSGEGKESFSLKSGEKYSKMLKEDSVKEDASLRKSRSPDTNNKKRKKRDKEKNPTLCYEHDSESEGHSRHKIKKPKEDHDDSNSDPEEPTMSFESILNYDVNVSKTKKTGVKKAPKKTVEKEEKTKDPAKKDFESTANLENVSSPKQTLRESSMNLMNVSLPAALPEWDYPSNFSNSYRKAEKDSDFCDVSEESAVFTGQRLNKKMQVYSGAKTIFLPTMMSLHQQCIRTLQNNINLLYETGGIPYEILEPVLERCTPEQLLRIEECNPMYVGVTDDLWGKHCQRDFKDPKLQEYESWKEMYLRLSEERERKLQRLTKTIVSAHSKKPKGRQVKMAFIHTVAKPPRDVRIQQELHGTAVPQPHQPRCSVKIQDNRSMPSCTETSRSSSSSSSSGAGNTQDSRKKSRVAPMMAKSLKAFKKQLGRR